ncbi:glycosyltransferase [Clostridium perfringens]|uniref:glycosyltransferase n=1 Tax=Clostridium perfringens TaxID=1502 RepID=UPI0032DBAB13
MRNKIEAVCAVIVTFNIKEKIFKCLESIEKQVDYIIIVDNGSNFETIDILKNLNKEYIKIIYNKNNEGIAKALNQGVKEALTLNYNWILTLDHDSICKKNMVRKMMDSYKCINDINRIGILCPEIYDVNGKFYLTQSNKELDEVNTALQSGCIFNKDIFNKVGFFNEKLFIYYVDEEFFDRCIKRGYKIIRIKGAILEHREGEKEIKRLFFLKTHYNCYSEKAIYYIVRNSILMIYYDNKKYFYVCSKRIIGVFSKVLLFDKKKVTKLKFALKGLLDGLIKKDGRL